MTFVAGSKVIDETSILSLLMKTVKETINYVLNPEILESKQGNEIIRCPFAKLLLACLIPENTIVEAHEITIHSLKEPVDFDMEEKSAAAEKDHGKEETTHYGSSAHFLLV